MARVLIVTSPEKGHVNPMVGVAQRLAERGHVVGWAGVPELPAQVRGLPVEPIALDLGGRGEAVPAIETAGAALAALLRDPPRLARWIRALLIDGAPASIAPLRAAIRAFDADLVAPDPMLYGAVIAAEREARPWVALSSSLNPVTPPGFACALTETVAALDVDRRALFEAQRVRPPRFAVCDAISPWLTGVFAPPEYADALGARPKDIVALGPSVPCGARGDEGARVEGERFVYVSFGSQAYAQPERYAKLIRAAADRDLVIAAGAHAPRTPAGARAFGYVDQRDALSRAALAITHGGANSVMEALSCGVPLLIAPIANDQPIQAAFVEAAGVGRAIDLERASVGEVRAAIDALLDDAAPERARARAMQRAYARQDGAFEAARRIEALLEGPT